MYIHNIVTLMHTHTHTHARVHSHTCIHAHLRSRKEKRARQKRSWKVQWVLHQIPGWSREKKKRKVEDRNGIGGDSEREPATWAVYDANARTDVAVRHIQNQPEIPSVEHKSQQRLSSPTNTIQKSLLLTVLFSIKPFSDSSLYFLILQAKRRGLASPPERPARPNS